MDEREARRRFEGARVARMVSVRPDGSPHIVPIVFALDGDEVLSVVDAKPKRTPELQRLANIEAEPRVSLLADHYDEDWNRIWWVRVDGTARVSREASDHDRAMALLREKYAQYETWPTPIGATVVVSVDRWKSWSLTGS